jgi:adenine phosphoribosyltransferase
MNLEDKVKSIVRDVKDFPKPGILFKDITPLLTKPDLVKEIAVEIARQFKDEKIDAIAAVEARGFIFGSILAQELKCAFIPMRKSGKLPYKTLKQEYALEYGTASVEVHVDAIEPGWKVLVHDDLLATGGTAGAAANLVKKLGGELTGFSFLINLSFLSGEEALYKQFGIKPQYLVSY